MSDGSSEPYTQYPAFPSHSSQRAENMFTTTADGTLSPSARFTVSRRLTLPTPTFSLDSDRTLCYWLFYVWYCMSFLHAKVFSRSAHKK